jgi:hypothetical protein
MNAMIRGASAMTTGCYADALSAMYARTIPSKSVSAAMPSAGPSLGAKFAGQV